MIFKFNGNKIVCSRLQQTSQGQQQEDVVEFDAHLNVVPVHVVARLSPPEAQELEHFLADKARLQAQPEHRVILEALPGLIDKVRGVLDSVNQIDEELHEKLIDASERLSTALADVATERAERESSVNVMHHSQALKKRLDIINGDI